jgi:hypothetical protein
MNNEYYKEQIRQLSEIMDKSLERQISFFQHLLLASAGIVGILISLHTTNSEHLYIRLVFFVSTVLLSLGVISLVLVLFDFSNSLELLRRDTHNEVLSAIEMDRECNLVYVKKKKRTLVFEKSSYLFLIFGFVLLIVYTGFTVFV